MKLMKAAGAKTWRHGRDAQDTGRRLHARAKTTKALAGAERRSAELIPPLIDQNSWAHFRRPMDMTRQGWARSLFQASQQ